MWGLPHWFLSTHSFLSRRCIRECNTVEPNCTTSSTHAASSDGRTARSNAVIAERSDCCAVDCSRQCSQWSIRTAALGKHPQSVIQLKKIAPGITRRALDLKNSAEFVALGCVPFPAAASCTCSASCLAFEQCTRNEKLDQNEKRKVKMRSVKMRPCLECIALPSFQPVHSVHSTRCPGWDCTSVHTFGRPSLDDSCYEPNSLDTILS